MEAGPLPTLDDLHHKIRTHRGCGFEACEAATNLVPGEGSATAEVMLIGEAPGATEDQEGRPFCGPAGRLLDELLAAAGLERELVYITNVMKARPPGNRDPRPGEVAHWLPYLEDQLALVQPRLVVPLGRHALAHFTEGVKISDVHGRLVYDRGRALYPMYHPAAGLRGTRMRETLLEGARRLSAALDEVRSGG